MSIVDSYIDGLLRRRHVERLLSAAEDIEDEASRWALEGKPKRAHYVQEWADRLRAEARDVEAEPLMKAMRPLMRYDGS